jgi:general secretion pathway protein M
MTFDTLTLPDGRRGQALALGITLIAAGLLWLVVISSLVGWYEARNTVLAQKRALAAHMLALERQVPALRSTVAHLGAGDGTAAMLVAGKSDAIAGANLQSALQDLAARAGTSLDSVAMEPARAAGALRRISVQVSVTVKHWSVLVAMLRTIETAAPRMIVDSISLTTSRQPGMGQPTSIQADISVTGFRAEDNP